MPGAFRDKATDLKDEPVIQCDVQAVKILY